MKELITALEATVSTLRPIRTEAARDLLDDVLRVTKDYHACPADPNNGLLPIPTPAVEERAVRIAGTVVDFLKKNRGPNIGKLCLNLETALQTVRVA